MGFIHNFLYLLKVLVYKSLPYRYNACLWVSGFQPALEWHVEADVNKPEVLLYWIRQQYHFCRVR